MRTRLDILEDIDKLNDENCQSCEFHNTTDSFCAKFCRVSDELRSLGDEYQQHNSPRVILKGLDDQEMTGHEMNTLKSNNFKKAIKLHLKGLNNSQVAKGVDVAVRTVSRYIFTMRKAKSLGVEFDLEEKVVKTVSTVEKVKSLKAAGMTDREVATELNLVETTVFNYKYR